MKRAVLFVVIAFAGCRHAHLGPDTNVATRTALAAQVASTPAVAPTFGADDARITLKSSRAALGKAGSSTASAPGSIDMPTTPAPDSGMGWPGAKGGISLEAK